MGVSARLIPDRTCFNTVIRSLAQQSDAESATAVLEQMRHVFPSMPNVVSYNAAMNSCARIGDLARAIKLFNQISSTRLFPDVFSYTPVIKACAGRGDLAGAILWLQQMTLSRIEPSV